VVVDLPVRKTRMRIWTTGGTHSIAAVGKLVSVAVTGSNEFGRSIGIAILKKSFQSIGQTGRSAATDRVTRQFAFETEPSVPVSERLRHSSLGETRLPGHSKGRSHSTSRLYYTCNPGSPPSFPHT
jgi:hypothetical protein